MTIKATDVTLEVGEFVEGLLDGRDDLFLVEVKDVILGPVGLVDLSVDDSLDREEDERLVGEQLLHGIEVCCFHVVGLEVIEHALTGHHAFEECVGLDDGKCLGAF